MAAINRTPQNTSYLQPTKFQISIPKITTVSYFCQKVNIPEIHTDPARQATPFVDLYRPGDKLQYNTLDVEFIVDEELWSYQLIHDWIRGYSFPCSFEEYKNMNRDSLMSMRLDKPQYSEIFLFILSSSNNPKLKIKFHQAFPIYLSEIQFDASSSAEQVIIAKAQFRYQLYDIQR